MGRTRKRQRRGMEHLTNGLSAGMAPTLSPRYLPVRAEMERTEPAFAQSAAGGAPAAPESVVAAPVLALEGLDPWAEIAGPALALEESETAADIGLTFSHPDQLELDPWSPERDAVIAEGDDFEEEDPPAERAEAVDAPAVPSAGETSPAGEREPVAASEPEPVAAVEPEPVAASGPEPFAASEPAGPIAEPAPVPEPPDVAELLYADARAAAEEGRAADAKRLYRDLVEQFPRHLRARNNLALLLDAAGDHDGALAELDGALELDAEHTTLLTNRGALLGALGRYAAAERDLRRVLRVEPANVEALFNLGVVMTKKGLWGEAVPPLRHVTLLAPDRGAAFYYLGEALNHVDDLLGALAAFQRATELQPANARALYGLGIIYDRLARPDDAALMYRKSREVARH